MSRSPEDERRLSLLVEIAQCPLIAQHFEVGGGPCAKVIDEQWPAGRPGASEWQPHHLAPEPWSGHIDRAPILFVASNPSLGDYHARLDAKPPTGYPTALSTSQMTEEYFEERFEGPIEGGIRNRGVPTIVRFWKGVLNVAEDLLPGHTVTPGIDYALTEVVRCKSKGESGVKLAVDTCTERYLEGTLEASPAVLIVVTGAAARKHFRNRPELRGLGGAVSPPVPLAGRERRVVFIPHPVNRRGLKYLISEVAPEAIEDLRAVCAAAVAR